MKSLKSLIKDKQFGYVNSNITEDNFPKEEVRSTDFKLFHFHRQILSEEVIKEMQKDGYEAANVYEMLTWKDWNDTDWVIALGSVAEIDGHRFVACLDRDGSGRDLDLDWFDDGWDRGCRFLGCKIGSDVVKLKDEKTCKHEINYCPDCGEKIR